MRTIYLSIGINIVQNVKLKAGQKRSASTGLALALLVLSGQFGLSLAAVICGPTGALAQSPQPPQTISSAGAPGVTDFSQQGQPKTRISRPHPSKNDGDIKLMPLQPVTDPIDTPPPKPVTPAVAPAGESEPPGKSAGKAQPKTQGQPLLQSAPQNLQPSGRFAPAPGAPQGFPPGPASGYQQGFQQAPQRAAPGAGAAKGYGPPLGASQPGPQGPAVEDPYPAIGRLETLTLGLSQPAAPITDRLARLETTVFKHVYNDDSLFDRTDRLKKTLLGPDVLDPNSAAARDRDDLGPLSSPTGLGFAPGGLAPGLGLLDPSMGLDMPSAVHYLDEIASRPENREAATPAVLSQFALELINYERRNAGLGLLAADNVAEGVAGTQVQELAKRAMLSHFSQNGANPDRRYTLANGRDAMVESIASVKCSELGNKKLSKAALAKTIKALLSRQDDRDALMAPDASHLGYAMALSADNEKILSALEVVTRHGQIEAIPTEVAVGEKLEIKGAIEAPYVFDRITVAWEAYNGSGSASSADESEDALPYFPPLDYVAYASKSDRDYSKAIFALKAAGVVAAIAGGMFIPPVALAAPLIMMSGGPGAEPKPVSDIPVKGGVKVDGAAFDAKIPISNGNKEGLYYITIYGALGSHSQQSVAISRRVVLARVVPKEENRQTEKVDEEVSAHADLNSARADLKKNSATKGGDDLSPAPSKNSAGRQDNANVDATGKQPAPVVFTPESKDEGKADAMPKQ